MKPLEWTTDTLAREWGDIRTFLAGLGITPKVSGVFSRHVPAASAETVIEGGYQVTLPRGVTFTPDVQYVIRPSGSCRTGNAVVIGAQLAFTF